jgi:hypothetical protein
MWYSLAVIFTAPWLFRVSQRAGKSNNEYKAGIWKFVLAAGSMMADWRMVIQTIGQAVLTVQANTDRNYQTTNEVRREAVK